jgi:hypothetical protein
MKKDFQEIVPKCELKTNVEPNELGKTFFEILGYEQPK